MIPEFPTFKPIELADRGEVEAVTCPFLPYSDFNFTSLWMWDVQGTMRLSRLFRNLIVRFSDYSSGSLFYSFIGTERIGDTAQMLLDCCDTEALPAALKLVPHEVASHLDQEKFFVSEDRDNFDYTYLLSDLRDYPGRQYVKKRNHVSCFLRTYPCAEARVINLSDATVVPEVLALSSLWLGQKTKKDSEFPVPHEIEALRSLLSASGTSPLVAVGVFVRKSLVAFAINELTNSEYVVAHVMKADVSVGPGVYAFLMQRNADILLSFGKCLFNYEQDLGIESLRTAKMRFRPNRFLKKMVVKRA